MFPVTGVSELNGSSKYTPEDCRGNGWELFSELTCGFSFVSLIRRKEKKMRRAAGWHMRSIFLLLCSGRVSKLSTQGCSFVLFFFSSFVIHHSDALRWTQMDITGHWALCVTGVWSLRWARITPGQITVSYLLWWNMKFLKREDFLFCSSSSLLYFWIIFVLKCATGRPLSQNVWQLWLWVFGVNGAGWDDEVS